jgi:hypothetical protein
VCLETHEHIGEVSDGVHSVRFAGGDERVQPSEVLAGLVVSDEEEILSSKCRYPQRVLGSVVVWG